MANVAIIASRKNHPVSIHSLLLTAMVASPFALSAQAAPAGQAASSKSNKKPVKQARISVPRLTRATYSSSSAIAAARNLPTGLNWRADPRARLAASFNGRVVLPGLVPVSTPIPTVHVLASRSIAARSLVATPVLTKGDALPVATLKPMEVRGNKLVQVSATPTATPLVTPTAATVVQTAPKMVPQAGEPVKLAALPKSEQAPKMVAAEPKTGATKQPDADRILLAKLEADLNKANKKLDTAQADLDKGQESLSKFTNSLRQAMMEAGPDAQGLHPFVRTAERYAGTPYVWGGESARGFDCSGFIIRVMRDLGYRALPHSAAEQFRYGKPIAQALLKPGDLVFFKNTYKPGISHVGIYLGRRRFIHAAGTGTGTIVSSLDQAKFQAKYAGARRLIEAR